MKSDFGSNLEEINANVRTTVFPEQSASTLYSRLPEISIFTERTPKRISGKTKLRTQI
jgi:hypothetical protein